MRPVPQLIAHLKADATLSAITDRVFADHPPQGDELPIVVLTVESARTFSETLDLCHRKLYRASLRVDIICDTRGQSEDIQEAVEDALVGFTSTDSSHPINGITTEDGVSWSVVSPIDGSDERGYWCDQSFEVTYQRV